MKVDSSTSWIASAPGRVNLIGEHTDYNLGYTLPLAIDRYTTIKAALCDHSATSIQSEAFPETAVFSPDCSTCLSHESAPAWSRYVAGVICEFSRKGIEIPPLKIRIESNVPMGAGVSSSASVEVATAMLMHKVTNRESSAMETALLCQRAEHLHAGVPCGLMDQIASISGIASHVMLLDCRSNTLLQVPFPDELAILVVNSNVKHHLADGEYKRRRDQCQSACRILNADSLRDVSLECLLNHRDEMPDEIFRRARHVITENTRTTVAAAKIADKQWRAVGELMDASHQSMRDDFEITVPVIDRLVEIAQSLGIDRGVFGSRMTGGGFGGSIISLALAEQAGQALDTIIEKYRNETGVRLEGFVTVPANGALVRNR